MIAKIEITNLEPINNSYFTLNINAESEFNNLTNTFVFKTVPTGPNDVQLSGTTQENYTNLRLKMQSVYAGYDYITFIDEILKLTIVITADDVSTSTVEQEMSVDIVHSSEGTAITGYPIILSRSPYFVEIAPDGNFDSATMDLRIWRGSRVDDYPSEVTFSFSKLVVQAGQPKIVFDIHKVVNDFVKGNYLQLGGMGAFTSSLANSVWISADITAFFQGSAIANATRSYLAVDGFGYHVELYNPEIQKLVLSSINDHVIYSGMTAPLYFKTQGLVTIKINGVNVGFSYNQEFSNQVIGYINLGAYVGDNEVLNVVFDYSGVDDVTHVYQVKSECLFSKANLIFKNRFGFWENIPFTKASKKSLQVEQSNYNGYISSFGQYSLAQHVKKTFQIAGPEKISVNTDFLPESYNQLFEEMFLSELKYLEMDGVTLPVNLVTDTFATKTKILNKLIQYSIDLEYSFDKINMIL